MRTITVALNLPRSVGGAILYARHVASCMDENAYFPSPPVAMATFRAHIDDLETAEVATLSRKAATGDRNAKLVVVKDDLNQLRTYVVTIARQHAEDAEAVIASSGMSRKQSAGPSKPDFAAKRGRVSGSVQLEVRHPGVVASFDWQYSTDGIHWVDTARSTSAKVLIEGLTPGTTYFFRYRTLTSAGTSDWSGPVALLVV